MWRDLHKSLHYVLSSTFGTIHTSPRFIKTQTSDHMELKLHCWPAYFLYSLRGEKKMQVKLSKAKYRVVVPNEKLDYLNVD